METKILLESGTNELQLLEFLVGDKSYGINIAKVSEMMSFRPVTAMPDSPPAIEGIFMPRDRLITVINLHEVLHTPKPAYTDGMIIVCEFNGMDVAFHVTSIKGINLISWTDIEKPPTVAQNEHGGLVTGVAKLEDGMILVLDFEKIVSDINKSAGLDTTGVDKLKGDSVDFNAHIVIAEDSPLLNKMIMETLHKSGFRNVTNFSNGKDAYDYIFGFRSKGEHILNYVSLLISDIEMPQMDGHHLTKQIKDDEVLNKIPVFLFSSLIDERMRKKGESVGADEQFSKPQITTLIETLYKYLKY